ncbi:uncharacterized protein LOC130915138 [Corythoichthys intestinalis]|uniref:uncharacterized protein LOC130915138 n=1 Tax=Corythoichthys intestinalis TaxID=161448 RepID=UPI0025A5F847|nr:uncharacterized protein LOC130915138 [Corythoichthys intestinalis]
MSVGLLLFLLLTGSASQLQLVNYPEPTCAARGSTVTLPCFFKPQALVLRTLWCIKHEICQGTKPSQSVTHVVYDSNITKINSRYDYLGDLKGNCTLRIRDIQQGDNEIFRFRMETIGKPFTQRSGVKVTVVEGEPMRVLSVDPGWAREGEAVTLNCTSRCSFLGLDVMWRRNGGELPETGPALRLSNLTAGETGGYTCALRRDPKTRSPPFNLTVEPRLNDSSALSGISVSLWAALVAVFVIAAAIVVILFLVKRRRRQRTLHAGKEGSGHENVYDEPPPHASRSGPYGQEVGQAAEEVNYAAVQFQSKPTSRPAAETDEDVVYSAVTKTLA